MFEDLTIPEKMRPSDPRFGVGPTLIPVAALEKLVATGPHLMGTSHRKPAVKNLVKEVQDNMREYFSLPDDYRVVLGNGGATLLFDAIGLGLVVKKIFHYTCGEFSQKWYKASHSIPWIEADRFEGKFGDGLQANAVADADTVAWTLNETSTGVMLTKLPEATGDCLLAVDATSGGGQVQCDISKTDIFFFSPQKVFASDGGLFVAFMSPRAVERALSLADNTSRYIPQMMNWKQIIDNGAKHQTYNTPAVATLFLLARQIEKMNSAGREQVEKDASSKAQLIYQWATEKEYLSPFVAEEEFRSTAVATVDVDERIDVSHLLKRLERERIVYNIDAYRKLGRNQFRIGLFFNIAYEDLVKLKELLSYAIEKQLEAMS